VHPSYNNLPDSGFDFALCKRERPLACKNWKEKEFSILKDTRQGPVDPEKLEVGHKIEINGYPGENKGFALTSVGKITKLVKMKYGG